MATAGDLRDHIKADLVINGTDWDVQVLNAIHSALRQLRGKKFWFLLGDEDLTTTTSQEYVTLPTDYAASRSFDMLYGGTRKYDGNGFDFLEYDKMRRKYWLANPIATGVPQACAVFNGRLYLSCYADATYTIPATYYRKDASLPGADDTSLWFDDGYDVVRALAQMIFKRDAQGFMATEEDGGMYVAALERLGDTHVSYMDAGR